MSRYDILCGRPPKPLPPEGKEKKEEEWAFPPNFISPIENFNATPELSVPRTVRPIRDRVDNQRGLHSWDQFAERGQLRTLFTGAGSIMSDSPALNDREELLDRAFSSAEGRTALAQAMVEPIRRRLQYTSLVRRILNVDPLPTGALPVYGATEAYFIDEDGYSVLRQQQTATNLVVPWFEIADWPTVNLHQVRTRRSSVIEGVLNTACTEIRTIEDGRLMMLFDAVISDNPGRNINTNTRALGSMHALSSGFSLIGRNDLRVGNMLMNYLDYTDLRNLSGAVEQLDESTHREMILAGRLGALWGTQISVSASVPHGRIYLSSEPTFTGVMPVREDISVLSADSPPSVGWSVFEQIGVAIVNPLSVASVTTSSFEGDGRVGVNELGVMVSPATFSPRPGRARI